MTHTARITAPESRSRWYSLVRGRGLWIAAALLLPQLVGCGVTSLQKEVDWYKQQLEITEDRRRSLELELADCERSGREWSTRSQSLRDELAEAKARAARLQELADRRRDDPIDIVPATTPEDVDLTDFSGIVGVEATRGEGNEIRLTLQDQILFPAGSVTMRKGGEEAIRRIAEALGRKYSGRGIRIEGHTDNVPPKRVKDRYPTNWELSTARACAVLRKLLESGVVDPTRVEAVGFGDQHPIATNETDAGKSQNRRVEVVVLGD